MGKLRRNYISMVASIISISKDRHNYYRTIEKGQTKEKENSFGEVLDKEICKRK